MIVFLETAMDRFGLGLDKASLSFGSLVEGGKGGLGFFGNLALEETLTFKEDEDGFRVVLDFALEEALAFIDCAFFI